MIQNFEEAIGKLDLELFSKIESQSTDQDKQSLLALQQAVRDLRPGYNYLEIGSHLGGSIQPHLLDDSCSRIFSIDKRPLVQPDARGVDFTYLNNSTEAMMQKLRMVANDKIDKVTTIDGDTGELATDAITENVQLCFIDGEHTDEAMKRDFEFCCKVLDPAGGAIAFHDAHVTYNGIYECIEDLKAEGVKFRAYHLPSVVFVVEIGNFPVYRNENILQRLIDNHEGYLYSLRENDQFRRFANRFPLRAMRNIHFKIRNRNVSN